MALDAHYKIILSNIYFNRNQNLPFSILMNEFLQIGNFKNENGNQY